MATILTDQGKQIVSGSIARVSAGPGSDEPRYIAWGSGEGQAIQTNTALFNEEGEARTEGAASIQTEEVANDTYQVTGALTALEAKTITEAGLFDEAKSENGTPGGNLFLHGDFDGLPLEPGDSVEFSMRVAFS